MQFVKEHIYKTLEVKKSKFIAHLIPYSLYDEVLKALKEEHSKARHFVVAWRYINEFDQVVEHCSDDGEPKGTSGKPTLSVLAGNELINSAVIIVRYFGGTKLGTGGLVRAYSDACNAVIKQSTLIVYVKLQEFTFNVKYTNTSLIEYRLEEDKILIKSKSFDEEGVFLNVMTDKDIWKRFSKNNERLICIKE